MASNVAGLPLSDIYFGKQHHDVDWARQPLTVSFYDQRFAPLAARAYLEGGLPDICQTINHANDAFNYSRILQASTREFTALTKVGNSQGLVLATRF